MYIESLLNLKTSQALAVFVKYLPQHNIYIIPVMEAEKIKIMEMGEIQILWLTGIVKGKLHIPLN